MSDSDLLSIRMLADQYSDAANRLDPIAMAATYAEDAELVAMGNPPIRGRKQIEAAFAGTIGMFEFMNQLCGAGVIDLDGDKAHARWTITELSKRKENEKLELFMGNYEDELVRHEGGWLFKRRTLTRRAAGRIETSFRK